MGFSVPLNFHKEEADCHIVQFKAEIEQDGVLLASTVLGPGSRELLFEKGEFVEKGSEYDGEFSALISGLLVSLQNQIKTIYIEGVCDMIRQESGEFINSLFGQFEYVYFKGELTDSSMVDKILNKVKLTRSLYFVKH